MTGSPTTTSLSPSPWCFRHASPTCWSTAPRASPVGMATNIPPHNLREAVEATCAFIDNPDITVDELMQVMPGPDFPTGAVIMGSDGIRQALRGPAAARSPSAPRRTLSPPKTGRSRLVFTEIPYQVSKGTLQEKIAQLVNENAHRGASPTCRDESTQKGIPPGHRAQEGHGGPEVVLNNLYKFTSLQTNLWREQPGARGRRAQVPLAARDPAPLR